MDPQQVLDALEQSLAAHADHTWEQAGRCVFCHDCGTRLYQGKLPPDRVEKRRAPPEPKATTEMRARWGKL